MRTLRASARGKVILFGEHAVVYGHPALAAAVDLETRVELRESVGPRSVEAPLLDERLQRVLDLVLPNGTDLVVETDLPVGRGMGSSASLSLALVRAAAAWTGESPDEEQLLERSLALEAVFHGRPSGVDSMVVLRGGLLRFRRSEDGRLEVRSLTCPPLHLVALDTGRAGDTASLVDSVARRRPGVDPCLAAIGRLVEAAAASLSDAGLLGACMDENHALLRALGVSTPEIEALRSFAREHGALGAKLSGAGGGGIVLALLPTPDARERLVEEALKHGIMAMPINLPARG
jgi:mevalonate kinase